MPKPTKKTTYKRPTITSMKAHIAALNKTVVALDGKIMGLKDELDDKNSIIYALNNQASEFSVGINYHYGQNLGLRLKVGQLHAALQRIDQLPAGLILEARTIAKKALS